MTIKVIIVRKFPAELAEEATPYMRELRTRAMEQPGYISGETLINADDPEEYLVISTWRTLENWNHWLNDQRRQEVQSKLDELLGSKTLYQVYYHG